MATETTTGAGATPTLETGATPTTASVGATPQTKPATSLEEAMARIAELEHATKNATEERDRHRKKLTLYEEAEKKAQEAALSEVDKATKRAAEAEQKIKQYQKELVNAQVKLAAKEKGIIDPDLAALAINDQLELDDDGMPTNVDKALDNLIKSKPYLVPKPDQAQPASPAQSATPAIPAMNPGRSSIVSPGNGTPGRIPSWNDVYKRP